MPETPRRLRVGQQVVRQQRVKVENGVAIEADVLRPIDQELDGVLVVEDHQRFESLLAFRFFPYLEQTRGIEQRIGVSLQTA